MIARYEGGYGWDRNDPGGPTKYGITCYDLAKHRGQKMNSMTAWAPLVKAMLMPEADDIYAADYEPVCRFNELSVGKDCAVFDFLVNSGTRAIRIVQFLVGVRADGVLGPITLQAINDAPPPRFINDLCDARLAFLHSLANWKNFGRGW